MLGIKTGLKKLFRLSVKKLLRGKLSNDLIVRELMESFRADEMGHQAKTSGADLGYGWIHYSFVRTIKPQNILCIGSRHGYIPAVLAQACKDNKKGHVDFVDPGYGPENKNHWTGVGYWKTKSGKRSFKKFGLEEFITLYVMTSAEFAEKRRKLAYEYIYIDGDHSYQGVKYDYEVFWPMLKNRGFMVFHDIFVKGMMSEGKYGTNELWTEISGKNAIDLHLKGSGLGIVQKV